MAVLCAVTLEMSPAALSSAIGEDLGVAAHQVVLGATTYAAATALLAIPLAGLARRWPLRAAVKGVGLLFSVVGVLTSVAPSLAAYLVARALNGAIHGVLFALLLALAASANPIRPGRAVGRVLVGNAVALAVGIPVLRYAAPLGWRFILATTAVGVTLALFASPRPVNCSDSPRAAASSPAPWVVVVMIAAGFAVALTGHFAFYALTTPITEALHVDGGLTLLVYGAAVVAGAAVSGKLAGACRLRRAAVASLVEAMALWATAIHAQPWVLCASAAVAGFCFGALPALVQTELIERAKERAALASGASVVAFNLGIASGAYLGSAAFRVAAVLPLLLGGALLLTAAIWFTLLAAHRGFQDIPAGQVVGR